MTKEEIKNKISEHSEPPILTEKTVEVELNRIAELEKENAELKELLEACKQERVEALYRNEQYIKENEQLRKTETMLKALKDRGVIRSWYYNGSYHVGNELPQQEN